MEPIQLLENLISVGRLSEALDFLETLSQKERQCWQIQNLTGIVCACCGQPQEARTFFEAALAQQPQDSEILYNLADTYAALRMNRKARKMLDRCQTYTDDESLMRDIGALRQHMAEQKGGRVLMAAYYFPPLSGSGVFRSIRFAKYLPLFGWEPTVISTDRPPNGWNFLDKSQLSEIPKEMNVVRIPDRISTGRETTLDRSRVQSILGFLRGVLRFSPEADRIFSQISRSQEGITHLLTFPCAALAWAYDVVQYLEKHTDLEQFQVVYTTSGPASAHLIGFYLKQKHGIPWVADYRDPWTFNAYGTVYDPSNIGQRLLFELESVLLHQADCSLTVEASLVQEYVQNFGLPAEKMVSITNGYDEENFSTLNVSAQTDRFTINYSGLLYSGHRNIEPILQAVQQLCAENKLSLSDIRFRVVGNAVPENVAAAQRYGLSSALVQTGYLSHRAALQSNLDSDLLLLLIGEGENLKSFYSAKIFEYLRSGKPILAIAPKGGVVEQLLLESEHGSAFSARQIPEIKAMILNEYLKWKSGRGGPLLHSPAIEKFEGKCLTRQLADVLDAAASIGNPLLGTSSGDSVGRITKFHAASGRGKSFLEQCAEDFLARNYNYVWLKAMLQKASIPSRPDAVLITGSSYGINGIIESKWNCAINCSASSQDLYYDFLCARKAVSGQKGHFSKCFIVGGYGDGGAIFTDDNDLAHLCRSLCVHGKGPGGKYDNVRVGINSRLDAIQAAILIPKLKALEQYELAARQTVARHYSDIFAGKFVTPYVAEGCVSAYAQYALLARDRQQRDRIIAHLDRNGIPNMIYYPTPQHALPVFQNEPCYGETFPNSSDYCARTFSVPMHPYLETEDQQRIIDAVLSSID